MSSFLSAKKLLLLGFIVAILAAIPLSVYVVQQQQETKSHAARSTSLSFNPAKQNATAIGQTVSFDIMLDPAAGDPPNKISFAKLVINYDPIKLAVEDDGFVLATTNAFASPPLEGPTYAPGSVSVTLSVPPPPSNPITEKTKIATISFKTLETTDSTEILFANSTQVLSSALDTDQSTENVLVSQLFPAKVITTNASATPVPTSVAGTNPPEPDGSNITCSALNLDRSAIGNAPYSITFAGTATSTKGTITKATFNFGDGAIENVTEGNGLNTNSVNIQKAHTYNNEGLYTANVTFTNNSNAVSSISQNCSKTITVNARGTALPTPTTTATDSAQIAPTEPVIISPTIINAITSSLDNRIPSPIPPTGPSAKIIGIGIIGAIITIIGGIIFFTL